MSAPRPSLEGYVPGRHAIEAYGAGGFRFAGLSHVGSILATPKGVRAVAIAAPDDIDAAALAPLLAELAAEPGSIEFVVIGTGARTAPLAPAAKERLRAAGLRFEAMATGPAARVYNVMMDERRRVAALLIAAP
ncbi:MAG TPA: Mth938-like domain-containing protein [Roseiarcus sp.]|nr:Mth938-like domain-containing protein [Roseiarcus sp.]